MILDRIHLALRIALGAAGFPEEEGRVDFSDRPDLCDFQTNCAFALAKKARVNPLLIAQKIADAFVCDGVNVACVKPGFINFSVESEQFARDLLAICGDERCGAGLTTIPKRILIDYGGPNIAKPLHVGHLRSAVIGECLKRLAKFLGHDVLGDIHLGDWGKQMGLVILGLMEKFDLHHYFDDTPDEPVAPPFHVDDFEEIYPWASARAQTDKTYEARAQDITFRLQNHERGYYQIWRDICRLSIEDIKADYLLLDVSFDLWYGESTCDAYVDPLLERLIEEGYAHESEGALILEVEEDGDDHPMPPVILRKSSGAQVYASTDLATLVQRREMMRPDEIWYVVDGRQKLHFQQVFRAAVKTGVMPESTKLIHVPFGTVNGPDGTPFKTREGGVMRLRDLIDMVLQAAAAKSPLAAGDPEVARKIGVAALKFGDLINNRGRNYIFDLDKFLRFEGKTGPYIQYTVARINSLFIKAGGPPTVDGAICLNDSLFTRIVIHIYKLNLSYEQAFDAKLPNLICDACFGLANAFNEMYDKYRILTQTDATLKNTLLTLCYTVRKCLIQALTILGIDFLEQM